MSLTYPHAGATRSAEMPTGWRHLRVRREIGDGDLLDRAGDVVLSFGLQRGAGLSVRAGEPLARAGLEVLLEARFGPIRLKAPTRVVYVVSEPDRRGFAYGTLAGHPESGEELFLVERTDGATYAEVRAFTRPGRWFTRLGRPVVPFVQRQFVRRYLDALERALEGPALTPALKRGEQAS